MHMQKQRNVEVYGAALDSKLCSWSEIKYARVQETMLRASVEA